MLQSGLYVYRSLPTIFINKLYNLDFFFFQSRKYLLHSHDPSICGPYQAVSPLSSSSNLQPTPVITHGFSIARLVASVSRSGTLRPWHAFSSLKFVLLREGGQKTV